MIRRPDPAVKKRKHKTRLSNSSLLVCCLVSSLQLAHTPCLFHAAGPSDSLTSVGAVRQTSWRKDNVCVLSGPPRGLDTGGLGAMPADERRGAACRQGWIETHTLIGSTVIDRLRSNQCAAWPFSAPSHFNGLCMRTDVHQ